MCWPDNESFNIFEFKSTNILLNMLRYIFYMPILKTAELQ